MSVILHGTDSPVPPSVSVPQSVRGDANETAEFRIQSFTGAARYHDRKVWLDRLAALVLLAPGLPIMGFLILLVRATSAGPGVYSQRRSGKHGRIYTMYKLRSMRTDAESTSGPTWSTDDDPRVTPVGKWLRKLHLDELPQLINVLRGDMSLIGPRPERPEFVEVLSREIPDYAQRLAVLPGVTGLAQINLPADTDLNSVRRKLVLDDEYIRKASLWLDLRILMCTLLRIVGLSGQKAMRVTGVQRHVVLPAVASTAVETKAVEQPTVEQPAVVAAPVATEEPTQTAAAAPATCSVTDTARASLVETVVSPQPVESTPVAAAVPTTKVSKPKSVRELKQEITRESHPTAAARGRYVEASESSILRRKRRPESSDSGILGVGPAKPR